jgi:hypothetical protein
MVARNPPSGSSLKRPQAQKLGASLDPNVYPRKSNSPSGTLQIRVFSSFTVSFSLPMISPTSHRKSTPIAPAKRPAGSRGGGRATVPWPPGRRRRRPRGLLREHWKCFATTGSSLQSIVLNGLGISFDGSVASWPYQAGYFLKDRLCSLLPVESPSGEISKE